MTLSRLAGVAVGVAAVRLHRQRPLLIPRPQAVVARALRLRSVAWKCVNSPRALCGRGRIFKRQHSPQRRATSCFVAVRRAGLGQLAVHRAVL